MNTRHAFLAAGFALAGCGDLSGRSYGLETGVADYDALNAATAKCQAQGGEIRLKSHYDSRQLSSYECVVGKAR